jgi:hypothetical protein
MVQIRTQNSVSERKDRFWGLVFLGIWALLIAAGVVTKRVFGHPELMMLWHVPAALFLAMAAHRLTTRLRRRYVQDTDWQNFLRSKQTDKS